MWILIVEVDDLAHREREEMMGLGHSQMRVVPKVVLIAFVLAGMLALSAPAAIATHVSCGAIITANTKLDSDLISCPGHGVVIGAPNITLNLNGHTIDGGGSTGFNIGIDNSSGYDGVTIKNGTVQGFSKGVLLIHASGNLVSNITAADNDTGILLSPSTNNRVKGNLALNNHGTGIQLGNGSDTNQVVGNVTSGNGDAGIHLENSDHNMIRNNTASDNFYGITLNFFSDANQVEGNTVLDNSDYGIGLTSVSGNIISANEASGNLDGIFVDGATMNTLLKKNRTHGNTDDGIDVDSPSTTITRNTADNNSDLGIEAVAGVTDGGGNKAKNNGNPLQCTHVTCL